MRASITDRQLTSLALLCHHSCCTSTSSSSTWGRGRTDRGTSSLPGLCLSDSTLMTMMITACSRVLCDIISCLLLLLLLLASNPTPSCFVRFYRKENSSLKYNCEKNRLRKKGRVSFIPQAVALSALYRHARFQIGGHEHLRCSFIWKAERRKEMRLRMKTSSGVRQERI